MLLITALAQSNPWDPNFNLITFSVNYIIVTKHEKYSLLSKCLIYWMSLGLLALAKDVRAQQEPAVTLASFPFPLKLHPSISK